ncbi:5-histidylcysteine sulfoxide synthase [Pseudanabaena sp. FACHB-1277]|uniref:5-histidylcysteine sulfoxide synthase n=1 Tax=Pseudanabaena cinerea FACHB-1277 TaxID=2949581 RepID=A0A926Z6M8_9CYAN|nr:5-histidylcysteine sulfoxide synthase [Pseudanabaena cinerea]MBD2148909.1 5-histidylcysteine sulfoxide synthase [Pseudanabaena cinerea FACHB-1277]
MNSIYPDIQPPNLHKCDRQDILQYFQRAWQIETDLLKSIIEPDTFYINPDPLRNLLIFYLGHSAVFYINKLVCVDLLPKRINPDFEVLFEIGVDPEKPEDIQGIFANLRQAAVEQVWTYRQQVYECISELIENLTDTAAIDFEHPLWALMMAIEHQYIHIETSSMLLRQLPIEKLQRPKHWQYAPSNNPKNSRLANPMISIDGGIVKLGKPQNDYTYGWDIEYGDRLVTVAPFAASKYLVTNAEFQEFVEAGGYENPDFWSETAWQWKVNHQVQHPRFWIAQGDHYLYRAMFDEIELPLDFPVEVNYYEAIAYCRWQSDRWGLPLRLMSEAEWRLATYGNSDLAAAHEDYNLNLRYGSPQPVNQLATNVGLHDLRGNVWQWLSDHLTPLDGYQPHHLYSNYSMPYFDQQHYMMAGGSWITNGTESGRYYRNWFRPHFYQHAGFRLATHSDLR